MYVFRGCASPSNDICPLVPRLAGGLAEWLRYFNGLAVGRPRLQHTFCDSLYSGSGEFCH